MKQTNLPSKIVPALLLVLLFVGCAHKQTGPETAAGGAIYITESTDHWPQQATGGHEAPPLVQTETATTETATTDATATEKTGPFMQIETLPPDYVGKLFQAMTDTANVDNDKLERWYTDKSSDGQSWYVTFLDSYDTKRVHSIDLVTKPANNGEPTGYAIVAQSSPKHRNQRRGGPGMDSLQDFERDGRLDMIASGSPMQRNHVNIREDVVGNDITPNKNLGQITIMQAQALQDMYTAMLLELGRNLGIEPPDGASSYDAIERPNYSEALTRLQQIYPIRQPAPMARTH